MIIRIIAILLILLLSGGAYFWVTRKPLPAPPVSNQVIAYQGSDKEQLQEKYGKMLVVYYTFTGITREVAVKLQDKTGADLYAIQLEQDYPASSSLYITSIRQLRNDILPALQDILVSADDYDTILVGSPVWWYTAPPPLRTYLAQTDFQGKKVAPFCTQGGNEGTYFEDFAARAKNAQLLEGLIFKLPHKQNPKELDENIVNWLEKIAQK